MKINFKKKIKTGAGGIYGSGSGGSGGAPCTGLPYTLNDNGEYVIDNTLISVKDIVAYSADSNFRITPDVQNTDLSLWELQDVTINQSKEGDILVFSGDKWVNVNRISVDGGTYKGF